MKPVSEETLLQDRILRFWFMGPAAQTSASLRDSLAHDPLLNSARWFKKSETFDLSIRQEFGEALERAAAGAFQGWKDTAEGTLAYILLTDQFPRNAFRGEPRTFAFDDLALRACMHALALRFDQRLHPIQRWFLYMPLEHSENPVLQAKAVDHFRKLVDASPIELRATFETALDFASRHRDVIDRFGRFPHRNVILNRVSTDEESAFLRTPGSSF